MNNINFGRALLGGLLAGLVLNIGEYLLNEVVLAKQMEEFFSRFQVPPPGGGFIALAVIMTFILGIVMVVLYALIRPRVGPGPKAAVIAAVIVWFGVYVYTGVLNGVLFAIPVNLMIIGMVWGLIEYIVAAIAGAWYYREA
ncbi:MAG TPA: hypothetical protein VJ124_25780 [Pyrinomonadaceae bacterium]|nr:hypothetical protein [Pyrinomonadaceae bacterium]